ncbi:TIGR02611 family protein [Gordonia liuliyuniae]|uniref:TIGR02611 family protein n=1 Tax=Gordonia liuliyuniae TaxID=2911517 RepID=A0ABS9IXI2_9ACTN|nr:TIGR02611 family protein [Gordonia liuliyuniae]MCF8590172.1 TIGR02611 family protein [Gordonia liuliyuniae]
MFAKLGARYHNLRHNHRYGFVLRYVTIVVGVLVTAVGVVAIPYPGPGWAMVFLGLLILSQELEWAARLRRWIMDKLNTFYRRYIDDNLVAQIILGVATCAIVIATLWVTDALDLVAGWVGIHAGWLDSPVF